MNRNILLLDIPEELRTTIWEIYDPDSFIDLREIIHQLRNSIIKGLSKNNLVVIKREGNSNWANLISRFILINQIDDELSDKIELRDFDLLTILEYPTSLIGMIFDWIGKYDPILVELLCEFITPDTSPEDGFKQVQEITKRLAEKEKELKNFLTQPSKDISISSLRNISRDTIEFQKKKESLIKVLDLLARFQQEYQPIINWRNELWSENLPTSNELEDIIDSNSEISELELVRAILLWSLKGGKYDSIYQSFWCRFGFEKAIKIRRIIIHKLKFTNLSASQLPNFCFIAGTTWDENVKYASHGKCLTPIIWTANQWLNINKL